jgi:hypothetical protein
LTAEKEALLQEEVVVQAAIAQLHAQAGGEERVPSAKQLSFSGQFLFFCTGVTRIPIALSPASGREQASVSAHSMLFSTVEPLVVAGSTLEQRITTPEPTESYESVGR